MMLTSSRKRDSRKACRILRNRFARLMAWLSSRQNITTPFPAA
jgi:hypothetical protein